MKSVEEASQESSKTCSSVEDSYQIFKLYNVRDVENIFDDVKVADWKQRNECEELTPQKHDTGTDTNNLPLDLTVSSAMTCSYCNVVFQKRLEQKSHYKLDWHRYNLKQKLAGKSFITEEKFTDLADNISSISGSDSETDPSPSPSESPRASALPTHIRRRHSSLSSTDSEDESYRQVEKYRRHSKLFFQNKHGELFSVYKCLLCNKKDEPLSNDDLVNELHQAAINPNWAIIMMGGGHFAGAIFNGNDLVTHKTFHSYTVRAKQGSSQSTRDNKGSNPKSFGANLRRYNEASQMQHIQDIMELWSDPLSKCRLVFLRAISNNRRVLFGGKNPPLKKHDRRLRTIPFPTRRATLNEVKRVHDMLSEVEVYGNVSLFSDKMPKSPRKPSGSKAPKGLPENDQVTKEPENILPITEGNEPHHRSSRKGTKIHRSKSRPSPKRPLPSIVNDLANRSSTSSEESDHLEVKIFPKVDTYALSGMEPSSLLDTNVEPLNLVSALMKEEDLYVPVLHPATKKKKGKIKKNEAETNDNGEYQQKHQTEPLDLSTNRNALNQLYTSCKLGDVEQLTETFAIMLSIGDDKPITILDETFGQNNVTLLHVAATNGFPHIIKCLLDLGADPSIANKHGVVPYNATQDRKCRNEFRKFMAINPDLHNYCKAQIPSPLSVDMEQLRVDKANEKRKEKKKLKKEKDKDRKQEEEQQKIEDKERERYLKLSDREKRALAAENRYVQQLTSSGKFESPVLSRCYECAVDITGKIPFEYEYYRFCSVACLKKHKKQKK